MEAPEVSEFRRHILEASWNDAEAVLMRLGVTDTEGLWVIIYRLPLCSCCEALLLFLLFLGGQVSDRSAEIS